jgi:hypothetical protein
MFTPTIGAELGIGELIGTRTLAKDDYRNDDNRTGNSKLSANSFYLNPSFVLRANTESMIVPYAKAGIFIGLATTGSDKEFTTHYNGAGTAVTGTDDEDIKTKGNVAMGFTSAVGLDFMLSDNFAIFGEVTGRLASWSPGSYTDSDTHTNYIGGVAQTSTTNSTSGNFVNKTPPNYTGTDTPSHVLPFSAIGLNVGVKFYFGK